MVCEIPYISRNHRKCQVYKNNCDFLGLFQNYDKALTTAKWVQDINATAAAEGMNEIIIK